MDASKQCKHCGEPLEPGCPIPVFHPECLTRLFIGSLGHIMKNCSCYGGNEDDPPGVSKRQAARIAVDAFHNREWEDSKDKLLN